MANSQKKRLRVSVQSLHYSLIVAFTTTCWLVDYREAISNCRRHQTGALLHQTVAQQHQTARSASNRRRRRPLRFPKTIKYQLYLARIKMTLVRLIPRFCQILAKPWIGFYPLRQSVQRRYRSECRSIGHSQLVLAVSMYFHIAKILIFWQLLPFIKGNLSKNFSGSSHFTIAHIAHKFSRIFVLVIKITT